MSEEDKTPIASGLQDRILDVIQDELAKNGGGMVNAFLLGVDYLDEKGEPSVIITVMRDQRKMTTAGLARWLMVDADGQIQDTMFPRNGGET